MPLSRASLLLLKRQDGSVDFYLNWTDYKNGFGNLEGEHWIGLDNMHLLTHQTSGPPQLRVDLADWEGNTAFAKYDQFSVGDENSDYTLSVSGYQSASTAVRLVPWYRHPSVPDCLLAHLQFVLMFSLTNEVQQPLCDVWHKEI